MKFRFKCCSKQTGKLIDQSFTILDLDNIGISNLVGDTKKFLQIASSIGQDYYPENLGKMFLVKCSKFFTFLWSIVKAFLDLRTTRKITIIGKDYQSTLLQYVDPENLPLFFGGKCSCSHIKGGCLFSDIGPWNPLGGLPPKYE